VSTDYPPDFVARFYDLIYKKVRSGVDLDYYMKKILEIDGPILELGVGTGRIFMKALEKGADIYGIDISPSMIEKLKEKMDRKYYKRVSVQDAANMNLDKKFDLIIAPFRVFSHIIKVKDQIAALDKIHEYLNDSGKLIFDLYIPNLKLLSEGMSDYMDFDEEYEPGKRIKRFTSVKSDLVDQISYVNMKFVWEETDKEIAKDWNFQMRFYFRFELEHLISQSRLKLMNIFGDFDENELNSDSKEFIVVCKKLKD
jgi:ubiquinone/menaquinone biosynthesis C-methylase UbiE